MPGRSVFLDPADCRVRFTKCREQRDQPEAALPDDASRSASSELIRDSRRMQSENRLDNAICTFRRRGRAERHAVPEFCLELRPVEVTARRPGPDADGDTLPAAVPHDDLDNIRIIRVDIDPGPAGRSRHNIDAGCQVPDVFPADRIIEEIGNPVGPGGKPERDAVGSAEERFGTVARHAER